MNNANEERQSASNKPHIPVKDARQIKNVCQNGEIMSLAGLVGGGEIKEQVGGKQYMIFDIQDSTGILQCKIWHDSLLKIPEKIKEILLGSSADNPVCANVGGIRESWQGNVYLNVKGLKIREGDDPINYVVASTEDAEDMFEYVMNVASSIEEPLRTILVDKLKGKEKAFTTAPAAKRYHDNFKAGLLEHTFKMLKSYVEVSNLYPQVNKSVMIFLIIQHDFEKINGYTLLPTIEWTDQEELVGHQVMGAINVYNELKAHDVDDRTIMAILNGIIAHHGRAEWGAAKPAMTIEARLLSHLDFMISDIAKANQIIVEKGNEEGKIDRDLFYTKYPSINSFRL